MHACRGATRVSPGGRLQCSVQCKQGAYRMRCVVCCSKLSRHTGTAFSRPFSFSYALCCVLQLLFRTYVTVPTSNLELGWTACSFGFWRKASASPRNNWPGRPPSTRLLCFCYCCCCCLFIFVHICIVHLPSSSPAYLASGGGVTSRFQNFGRIGNSVTNTGV